ncbi:MAG: Uma2 family endonuclease [Austwickia sp.]|jgi:Uma2 family endonuclease|nr:MAG: Uma2 family endonuclease [Austwickia sp.]
MVSMTAILRGRDWTRDDRDALPDDGHRYEVLDGTLVVTPAPSSAHQIVLFGLYRQLHASCPLHLRVLGAPLDVLLDERTVLQPDLLVARRDRLSPRGLTGPPELAIEILSPSTQTADRTLKRERYERAATPAYWLADPDTLTLTVYELNHGHLRQSAHLTRHDTWTATSPYAATITPAAWLD